MKTRILQVAPSLNVQGGISSVLKMYLKTELPRRHHVDFVATHVDGAKPRKLMAMLYGLVKLFWVLSTRPIDLVHIHCGDIPSPYRKLMFLKISLWFKKPTIVHLHGALFLEQYARASAFGRKRLKHLFEQADAVICLSQSWSDAISALFPGATRIVLSNGIFLPEPAGQIQKRKGTVNILFLGLIGPRKGLFDLLTAFERLVKEGFDIHLSIGGNGQVSKLQKRLLSPQLEHTVDYHGWVGETEKKKLLEDTDIFVLPSYGEGMPISVLEAMSYGVPVISTRVGAIPEQVEDGATGYLIPPGDVNSLYDRLKRLIQEPHLRIGMGTKGRQKAEATFDMHKNGLLLSHLYHQFANNKS